MAEKKVVRQVSSIMARAVQMKEDMFVVVRHVPSLTMIFLISPFPSAIPNPMVCLHQMMNWFLNHYKMMVLRFSLSLAD